jgi:hypothetical protein
MPVRLGELLLKEKMITPQQLQEALNHQWMSGGKLSKAFVSLGFVTDEEITSLMSRHYGVPSIDLDRFAVDPAIIKIIPAETARKYQVLPLSRIGATLTIAIADPTHVFAIDDIKFMTGYNVEAVVASESVLEGYIGHYYGSTRSIRPRRETGSRRGAHLEAPTPGIVDMAGVGGLSGIDLIEPGSFPYVLIDLHRHGATGSLKVIGPMYSQALYFREGRILFGSSTDPRDQLGAILVERSCITREQLQEANAQVGPGNPLARVLAESGFVNRRELGEVAREKVERILAGMLSRDAGSFEFEAGILPKGAVDLEFSTARLILAAVKRSEPPLGLRLVEPGTVLEPAPEGEAVLSEVRTEVWPLLRRLDGRRSLEEAIRLTRLDEFGATKTAWALLLLGVVRGKEGDEERGAAMTARSKGVRVKVPRPAVPDAGDKRYAYLFASWQDESYWVGEVRENKSLGIHVFCLCGRGKEFESRHRGDANDRAVTVAEAVDYLTTLRALEVEQRSSTHGPPVALDAAFVDSGDSLKMTALLKERDRAWDRHVPKKHDGGISWLPWIGLPVFISMVLRHVASWSLLALVIGLVAVGTGAAVVLEGWVFKRLRHKVWRA